MFKSDKGNPALPTNPKIQNSTRPKPNSMKLVNVPLALISVPCDLSMLPVKDQRLLA